MSGRISAFGPKVLKRFPELAPLFAMGTFVLVGATGFGVYSLYQKPDVRLLRYTEEAPHEKVDPEKSQKLYHTNKAEFKRIEELEQLKKEIGSLK